MNGGTKCTNWGSWGAYGSLKVIGNVTIRQSTYDFLFDFNRNHASILYCFRDIAGYLSKVADFEPPHLHLGPRQGVIPVEFRLRDPTFSRFSSTPTCDRQTDGQTDTGPWLVPRMHSIAR